MKKHVSFLEDEDEDQHQNEENGGQTLAKKAPKEIHTNDLDDLIQERENNELAFLRHLTEGIDYKKIKHNIETQYATSINYDSKLYDISDRCHCNIVEGKLINLFGTTCIHLQNPERSREWLQMYKKKLQLQEEAHIRKILMQGRECDKRIRSQGVDLKKKKEDKIVFRISSHTRSKEDSQIRRGKRSSESRKHPLNVFSTSDEQSKLRLRCLTGLKIANLYEKADEIVQPQNLFPERNFHLRDKGGNEKGLLQSILTKTMSGKTKTDSLCLDDDTDSLFDYSIG